MDYILHYDEIKARWCECEKEIQKSLCDTLHVPYVQLTGKTSTSHRQSPLTNINLKLIVVTPKVFEGDRLVFNREWYRNTNDIQNAAELVMRITEEHGFLFMGCETESDGSPVFVVKLGD